MNRIMSHYQTKNFTLEELDAISREHKNDGEFTTHYSETCHGLIAIEGKCIKFYMDGENPNICITAFVATEGLRFKMHFSGMSKADLKQRNFDLAFAAMVTEAFSGAKVNLIDLSDRFEIRTDAILDLELWGNPRIFHQMSA